jgi:nicotinate-nucleotide pyrophosphorylase (carboxylating)
VTSDAGRIAAVALAEDGETDITTALTVPPDLEGVGRLEYRSGGVVAGAAFADAVATACECRIAWRAPDGRAVPPGTVIGIVHGPLHRMLRAERPMLNLLQRACGIASATRDYVDAVAGTRCRILHTRKTAPGLRALDVAAVLSGGGARHRIDLGHELMVKDNHWQALRLEENDLAAALARARSRGISALQVEVESIQQVEDACAAGATRLLVDNQPPSTVRAWAERARELVPGIEIEATGGITLENVRSYAEAGVDFVSIGALTHSVMAANMGLEVGVR